jgi:hypothetical protein
VVVQEGFRPDQRLLLLSLGQGHDCVHCTHQLWQVGSLEGRLGGHMGRCARPPGTATESLTSKKTTWEEAPKLHVAYGPMIERIKHLMSHGLLMMMVLHDFLSRRITPLHDRARPGWMYIGEDDTMQLEHGHDSCLDPDVLRTLLGRLSPDSSSVDFMTPLAACAPMCLDQAA